MQIEIANVKQSFVLEEDKRIGLQVRLPKSQKLLVMKTFLPYTQMTNKVKSKQRKLHTANDSWKSCNLPYPQLESDASTNRATFCPFTKPNA